MEVIAFALAIGVVIAVVTGGSVGRLLDTRIRAVPLAFAALGIQLVLGAWSPPGGWTSATAFILYLGSFLLLAAFCALNLHLTGMSVVLVGVALNAFVVALNGGMPVRLATDATAERRAAIEQSHTLVLEEDADRLAFLGEIVVLPNPVSRSVSFGDLILGVGLVDLVFHASRRPRQRPAPVPVEPRIRTRAPAEVDAADGSVASEGS